MKVKLSPPILRTRMNDPPLVHLLLTSKRRAADTGRQGGLIDEDAYLPNIKLKYNRRENA